MKSIPPEITALLMMLGKAGIELAPHPDDLIRLRHRPAALPQELSESLRLHRAAIRELLENEGAVNVYLADPNAEYVYTERLGMAEDLRQPTHLGSSAWMIAVAECAHYCCSMATMLVHSAYGIHHGSDYNSDQSQRRNTRSDCKGSGSSP